MTLTKMFYYAEADETSDEEDEVCEICEHYGMLCQGCASYYGIGPLTKGYKKDMDAESTESESFGAEDYPRGEKGYALYRLGHWDAKQGSDRKDPRSICADDFQSE